MKRKKTTAPASKTGSSWAETQSEVLANRPNKEKGSCECGDNWSERVSRGLFFSLFAGNESASLPPPLRSSSPSPLPLGQRRGLWHVHGTGAYSKQGEREKPQHIGQSQEPQLRKTSQEAMHLSINMQTNVSDEANLPPRSRSWAESFQGQAATLQEHSRFLSQMSIDVDAIWLFLLLI